MPLSLDVELKTPEKKDRPLIPEDVYEVEITDLTAEESEWKGEKRDMFKFEFTIIEDGPYYGRKVRKKGSRVSPCPSTNNSKAPLTWKVASAILKHPLTKEEGKSFTIADMNTIIGKQLRVGVVVTALKDDGKQYNNAESFFMPKVELPKFDEAKVKKEDNSPAGCVAATTQPSKFAQTVAEKTGGKFGATQPDEPEAARRYHCASKTMNHWENSAKSYTCKRGKAIDWYCW